MPSKRVGEGEGEENEGSPTYQEIVGVRFERKGGGGKRQRQREKQEEIGLSCSRNFERRKDDEYAGEQNKGWNWSSWVSGDG
jgi:hypothetical protein